jgi:hypothetical protein
MSEYSHILQLLVKPAKEKAMEQTLSEVRTWADA